MNFLVNLYDAEDGELLWTGHAEDFLGINQNDEELEELLMRLSAEGDQGTYGCGVTRPRFTIERI